MFETNYLTFVIFISWCCFWCLFHKIWWITNCLLLIVSISLWPNMYCLGFAASLVLSQTNQVNNLATASAIIEIIWVLMQSSKLKNKIKETKYLLQCLVCGKLLCTEHWHWDRTNNYYGFLITRWSSWVDSIIIDNPSPRLNVPVKLLVRNLGRLFNG